MGLALSICAVLYCFKAEEGSAVMYKSGNKVTDDYLKNNVLGNESDVRTDRENNSNEKLNSDREQPKGDTAIIDSLFQKKLVNINTADESELTEIKGIGPSKAAAVLRYRTEHGAFQSIEDIMKVPGIKEGTFNKIKDLICVEDTSAEGG